MRHKALAAGGVASGALASLLAYRRLLGDRRGRVDVYLDNGSFVTFVEGSEEGERFLPLAREALAAVREA